MTNKPGVMIYFDLLPVLANLSDGEKGKLFEAILYYARDGVERELPERTRLLWPLIRMRLDSDDARYGRTVSRGKYAAYVRWARQKGKEPLDYVQWQIRREGVALDDDYRTMNPEYLSDI